jgi:hypothetical protein
MRKPVSFLEPLELSGHWFLPNDDSRRCAGRLNFSADGMTLSLLQPLRDAPENSHYAGEALPVMFGCTEAGEAVTLFRSNPGAPTESYGSACELVSTQAFRPHMILIGAYFGGENRPITAIRARIPGLLTWLECTTTQSAGVQQEQWHNQGVLKFNISMLTSSGAELKFLPAAVKISKAKEQSYGPFGSVNIRTEAWLEIRPCAPLTIDDLLVGMNQVLSVLGLIAGPCMHFDSIELEIDDENSATLLFRPNRHRVCDVSGPDEFLIPYETVRCKLSSFVENWMTAQSRFRAIHALFETTQVAKRPPLHLIFLTLTHVLEGLHRTTHSGLYMDPVEYQFARQELTSKLPNSIVNGHRDSFKKRIEFGNEISFRTRLQQLVRSFPDELRILITGINSGVPATWLDTRNYYTHWTDELQSKAAEGANLYFLNFRLMLLARALLLRAVQVPDQVIQQALVGRNRWARELTEISRIERKHVGI